MATTRTFNDMLNEFLPNSLLMEEMIKRDYFLTKMERDDSWKSGKLIVPFRAGQASSISVGSLTDAADISQSSYIRGSIDDYVEVWGSLVFNHRDLQEHNGKIPESTFLKILPDEIDNFMDYMKETVSYLLACGPNFATVTDGTNVATGVCIVDRVDRFTLGQKCFIDDSDTTHKAVYVIAINLNTSAVTFSDSRGGSAYNLSSYATGTVKFYAPGVEDGAGNITSFTSIKSALLSAANGGSSTLHGKSKVAYPHLQAINVNGSSISATNILEKLFDAYSEIRMKARGNANTIVLAYKHLGSIMKLLEDLKGSFKVTKDPKASLYGWTELEITSVKGTLTIAGVQEMDEDVIFFIDWSSFKFMTNGGFKKRVSPDGKEYFETRATTGYQYIVDVSLFGDTMFTKPTSCGIIYGITDY